MVRLAVQAVPAALGPLAILAVPHRRWDPKAGRVAKAAKAAWASGVIPAPLVSAVIVAIPDRLAALCPGFLVLLDLPAVFIMKASLDCPESLDPMAIPDRLASPVCRVILAPQL